MGVSFGFDACSEREPELPGNRIRFAARIGARVQPAGHGIAHDCAYRPGGRRELRPRIYRVTERLQRIHGGSRETAFEIEAADREWRERTREGERAEARLLDRLLHGHTELGDVE